MTNFDLTTNSLIKKYQTISIKFKTLLNLLPKLSSNKEPEPNQTLFDKTYSNLTSFFIKKYFSSISMTFKIEISQFYN